MIAVMVCVALAGPWVAARGQATGQSFRGQATGQDFRGWTRFRGPNGAGLSGATTIPIAWSEEDYNWRVELPGAGHSSPVLWGERVFITAYDETSRRWMLLCLSAEDGRTLWAREEAFEPFRTHEFNSFASATPAVDEHHVYACWSVPQRYVLMAFDHEGRGVWELELGPFESQWGSGASPIVYEDMVVLANDQLGDSSLIAVDRMTGRVRWQAARPSAAASYAAPTVYRPEGGPPQLLINSEAAGLAAYDPRDGRLLWRAADIFDKRSLSCPVIAGGLVFASCGSGGGGNYTVAVRPPSRPGGEAEVAYRIDRAAAYVPTPVAVGDRLFMVSDGGIASCIEPPTGRVIWRQRLRGEFFGSPVAVNGVIYAVSRRGDVHVFRAADTFELLALNELGEMSHSTPAVAGGRMYLRTVRHLMSIGGEPPANSSGGR